MAGQIATTAATGGWAIAAAFSAQKAPMLDPRSATCDVCSRISSIIDSTSAKAVGPNSPSERPWPRASKATAAMPAPRAVRPKSKCDSFADPAPWQITMAALGASSGRKSA